MNRHQVKKLTLPVAHKWNEPLTNLIYMATPHTNGVPIGTVPFHMSQRGPLIPIRELPQGIRLTFDGKDYKVNGWGPTDAPRQRAILGPWGPELTAVEA